MSFVIEIENLRKVYGEVVAVDDVSLRVQQGEIFGMVGPNGAGKTTTIECLEGLRQPDEGSITVMGFQPWSQRMEVVEHIGVQLQVASLPARLRVGEALRLIGSLYSEPVKSADLLERMGLSEKVDSPIAKLSGGQRQRLFIALALINHPQLVFLDELTTGLDPQARRSMWDLVREIRAEGCTVFLTTHYMEEAERLCDRVAILDHGKLIALDSPAALIRSITQEKRVIFSLVNGAMELQVVEVPGVTQVEAEGDRVSVQGSGDRFISSVVSALEDNKVEFRDLRTEQPNLEDVFLQMTGRKMRD